MCWTQNQQVAVFVDAYAPSNLYKPQPEFEVHVLEDTVPYMNSLSFVTTGLSSKTVFLVDTLDMDDEKTILFLMDPENEKKILEKWSDVYILRSRYLTDLGTDKTAGSSAAVAIAEMTWKCGSFPTLEDLEAILSLVRYQHKPEAALVLGTFVNRMQAPTE